MNAASQQIYGENAGKIPKNKRFGKNCAALQKISIFLKNLCWQFCYVGFITRSSNEGDAPLAQMARPCEMRRSCGSGFVVKFERSASYLTGFGTGRRQTHDTCFGLCFLSETLVSARLTCLRWCVRSLKIAYRRKRNVGGRVTASVWGQTFSLCLNVLRILAEHVLNETIIAEKLLR